jgi:hypothetical protein
MVSPNEAGLHLQERALLPRYTLHTHPESTGQRMILKRQSKDGRDRSMFCASPKAEAGHLTYPASIRDTAKSGIGGIGNRHLNDLVRVHPRERGRLITK